MDAPVDVDVLEPESALPTGVRRYSTRRPSKYFTAGSSSRCLSVRGCIGVGGSVPENVPERGSKPVIRQATPTKFSKKNGLEIVDFRPVL